MDDRVSKLEEENKRLTDVIKKVIRFLERRDDAERAVEILEAALAGELPRCNWIHWWAEDDTSRCVLKAGHQEDHQWE